MLLPGDIYEKIYAGRMGKTGKDEVATGFLSNKLNRANSEQQSKIPNAEVCFCFYNIVSLFPNRFCIWDSVSLKTHSSHRGWVESHQQGHTVKISFFVRRNIAPIFPQIEKYVINQDKICILRLAHSCILDRVLLHTGACANAALLTHLLTYLLSNIKEVCFLLMLFEAAVPLVIHGGTGTLGWWWLL